MYIHITNNTRKLDSVQLNPPQLQKNAQGKIVEKGRHEELMAIEKGQSGRQAGCVCVCVCARVSSILSISV